MPTGTNLLKEHIIRKYGTEKFQTGCLLVSQWLNIACNQTYTQLFIQDVCNDTIAWQLKRKEIKALKGLLGKSFGP